ncbi:MAG: HD domain-containing phosphohydrolase [Pseudomonadota bacterium]
MAGQKDKRRVKFSIRITVVGMFLVVTTLTAAVAIGLQYHFSTKLVSDNALNQYRQAAANTRDHLQSLDRRAEQAAGMLANYPDLIKEGVVSDRARRVFAQTLRQNPIFYAIYIGRADGGFYELVNLDSSAVVREQLRALPQDRWVVIRVEGEGEARRRQFGYYDEQFRLRARRDEPTDYRASARPWYRQATEGAVHKTDPYLFQHLQAPGQTYSTRIPGEGAVLGVDIALASLSEQLNDLALNSDSRTYLYQASGQLIASSEESPAPVSLPASKPLLLSERQRQTLAEHPVLTVSNELDWQPFDFAVAGEPRGYSIDVLSLVAEMTGLELHYVNGLSWPELKARYRAGDLDILHPVLETEENTRLGHLSAPLVEAYFGVVTRSGEAPISRVEQLFGRQVAIPSGWSSLPLLRRDFTQIDFVEVEDVAAMFAAVRNGEVSAGIDIAALLRYTSRQYFYDDVVVHAPLDFGEVSMPSSLHYLVRPEKEALIPILNQALANITPQQRQVLANHWLFEQEGGGARASVPYVELVELAAALQGHDRMQKVSLEGREHFVYLQPLSRHGGGEEYFAVLTPVESLLAPVVGRVKAEIAVTAGILLLMLPFASQLAGYIVRPVKQLAHENEKLRQRRFDEVGQVDSRIVEIDHLATSLVTAAGAMERHAKEQEALMDAFIQVIAQAIDDKSPYTGAHCKRVPELAMLLAEKAHRSEQPPFDRFGFSNEAQWREFRIGAWLHDCGKITTPEHVVDKATKLETIHNRIHEIRTRFEVLWRDAVIEYWQQRAADPEQEPQWREAMEARQTQLREDFAFIAASNIGGEFMSDDDVARLERLAAVTWQRHFDDRLGLSPVELARFGNEPAPLLPATEPLLADKTWHLIKRTNTAGYPERLGIRMEVPQYLYNRGELHNLRVARGTLSPEDRFKINEHMISTIRMLDRLPLPEELARVPRYASTHHETLDGRGYPRQLSGKDLSTPERIMVLADIFEALTASDRPYKKAKPVSVAIDILYQMVRDRHVDRDVFELFLTSGAYLEYAERYLPRSQIDTVDVQRYLDAGDSTEED